MTNEKTMVNGELILASEKIENAKEIFEISLAEEKYPFIIKYSTGEKTTVISQLKKIGCSNLKQLDFANCIAASLSMSQLKAIKTLTCVEKVEKDYDYRILSVDNANNKLTVSSARINPQNGNSKIKMAVFDTCTSIAVDGSVDFVNDTFEGKNSHGEKMIGIISSVIKNLDSIQVEPQIFSVVVANYKGLAKSSTIMQAIEWAINNEIKIINMSFGDYHKSVLLEEMINKAASNGIVMVAATGNDGEFKDETRIMYPAAFDNVLSVGATSGENVSKFSNGGKKADFLVSGFQNIVDSNGPTINVVGTSAAAAYVSSELLRNYCATPESDKNEIISKTKNNLEQAVDDSAIALTSVENDGILNASNTVSSASTLSLCNNEDCDCVGNNRLTAKHLNLITWYSGQIKFPRCQQWYQFKTNAQNAHPNGDKAKYVIHTRGSLDTVGELYDSNGNYVTMCDDCDGNLNFKIIAELEYGETYYICVRAFGDHIGSYDLQVTYFADDHGNSIKYATEVRGVYFEDKSITASLHSNGDIDYYKFVPARDCVMEIYTEGDTNTYGRLYCANGSLINSDNDSNGNGNFKLTVHLEAMQWYYLAVSHNSFAGYGDYTLRFKFVKDVLPISKSPLGAIWINDNYNKDIIELAVRSLVYISDQDCALWKSKIQQTSFINSIEAMANQSLDSLIEELLLHGFSTSFSYNMAQQIIDILEIIEPYFNYFEFNEAYDDYVESGYKGFVMSQNYTLKRSIELGGTLAASYVEDQAYVHYPDNKYMYGYYRARGHFEYR